MHGRFRNLSPLLYPLPVEASLSKKAPSSPPSDLPEMYSIKLFRIKKSFINFEQDSIILIF